MTRTLRRAVPTRAPLPAGLLTLATLANDVSKHTPVILDVWNLQVFDLGKYRPDQVLEAIWANFGAHLEAKTEKEEAASEIRKRLRIVAAGGDGTVAWVLQVRTAQGPNSCCCTSTFCYRERGCTRGNKAAA
jgi:Diacylglycerol kinase catalytic domain